MRILKHFALVIIIFSFSMQLSAADKYKDISTSTDINLGNGMKITKIIHPLKDFDPEVPVEPQTLTKSQYQYPTIPLAGFTPYVAVMVSDKALSDTELIHELEDSYVGRRLKSDPNSSNPRFVVGILDSGADADLVAGSARDYLGIDSDWLTDSVIPIGGAGPGSVDTYCTYPMALFAAGLGGVETDTMTIDPNYIIGHSNASLLAAPPIECNGYETVSAAVGRPLMSFYTTMIRNDIKREVSIGGRKYTSPDITFGSITTTDIPAYTRRIPININAVLPPSTAAWSYTFDDMVNFYPAYPTMLTAVAGLIPTGGYYEISVDVKHGTETKTLNLMLDTGAQSTLITTTTADSLSLPLSGDFVVEVCGVAGSSESVDGYYLDEVGISAGGGRMNFSHVPVIVLDIAGGYDGILGMNFFYDRNISFQPDLATGSAKLFVSDPVDYADADFNDTGRVDLADFAMFSESWLANFGEADYEITYDLFLSDSIGIDDMQVFVDNWLKGN